MEENQTNQNNLNQQPVQPEPQMQQQSQSEVQQVQTQIQAQPVQQPQQSVQQVAQSQQSVQQVVQSQQPAQQVMQPQQSVQQEVQQPVQTQQSSQPQQATDQASVSMQIQELLVKQQQYQQQYNQLVDYVKKTPNLPIEQVNQIKVQLDQLNLLFVQWKQKLQELWYNQVQVNKSVEVKKWSSNNFSFRKLAIWCIIVVIFILAWLFITIASLVKNPQALSIIKIEALQAKQLIQAFTILIFWSVILLMIWVIVSNIYKLVTVKNQSRWKTFLGLLWWILGAWIMWVLMWFTFKWIWTIVTEVEEIDYDIVQPYIVWRVKTPWVDEFNFPYKDESIIWKWEKYPLIAPSEMAFSFWWDEFQRKVVNKYLKADDEIVSIKLLCGNKDNKELEWTQVTNKYGQYIFDWTCLYPEKWEYTYSISVIYNSASHERLRKDIPLNTLDFTSKVAVSKTTTKTSYSNNQLVQLTGAKWEFNIWTAPAKITIDSTQVFSDFGLQTYDSEWDMDWDFTGDRVNQTKFDFTYRIPQVYYVTYKISWLNNGLRYRFPVRVEQSDRPVCSIKVEEFRWTTKYKISSEFVDPADAWKISSYNYTIINSLWKKEVYQVLKDQPQEFNYTFPDKWSYQVILDYVTIDWKQWQCESETIALKKETFDIQYSILIKDNWKFKEYCSSNGEEFEKCTKVTLETFPQEYQLHLNVKNSDSNTLKKVVLLNDTALLDEGDIYTFKIEEEWEYSLEIKLSDPVKWMEEEVFGIKIIGDKPDIVGNLSIMSNDKDYNKRKIVSEWFEPLTVILDASKTEINVPWDEIIYFTWDFDDWEVKKNQQNWLVSHTYYYDYERETWIFEPKVTVTTRDWLTSVVSWPKLNVKKWLTNIELNSPSHPSRQAPVWTDVTFSAEFDWLPEKMIWDFWDGTPTETCDWRNCTEIVHIFKKEDIYSIKLTLEFDAIQQVDATMDFKTY